MLDDRRSGAAELAQAIGIDPALLPAFTVYGQQPVFLGIAAKISSARRALRVLGNPQIHNLVLATSLGETFVGVESTILNMLAPKGTDLFGTLLPSVARRDARG